MSLSDSELDEEQLDHIVTSVQPKNTERSTKWGVRKFEQWLAKRAIICDFASVESTELAGLLRRFYGELKSCKHDLYSASALTGIRAALQRTFSGPPYNRNINIITGTEFVSANKMFVAKCKQYVSTASKKPQHKPPIADGDMAKLSTYFMQWDRNPEVLVEAVWFLLCYHFGRRGREGWTTLSKDSFEILQDSEGDSYIATKLTETTKNHQGGYKQGDVDYSNQRMYGSGVPVYSFYLGKLHSKCNRLFQTPLRAYSVKDGCWFKNEPMGKSTLGGMMQRISRKADLSQVYTCHSVRVSTITKLFQAGVSCQQIMTITKHKRETSLKPYISDTSEAQKKANSSILDTSMPMQVCNFWQLITFHTMQPVL